MKLSALNSAVRNLKGAPKIRLKFTDGGAETIILENLEVTKQSLLESLKVNYPDGRNAETGLCLVDGMLCRESAMSTPAQPVAEAPADVDLLDDLLG